MTNSPRWAFSMLYILKYFVKLIHACVFEQVQIDICKICKQHD